MDFFKKNWGFWVTLAFFALLSVLNIENLWLSLLVFIFLFPFTRRGFIAKALFFVDFVYLVLLEFMILLSLIVPDSLFEDTLYIGLVITVWGWIGLGALSGALDDDVSEKGKIIYFALMIATPFVSSAISTFVSGGLRTILCWIVGLTSLASLVSIFNLPRALGLDSGSSGGSKMASYSRVESAAKSAARACRCDVVRVEKNGGGYVIVLSGARDSYGWSDVSNEFMEHMYEALDGYDVGEIRIAY